jgi:uncharacterized RDD family membrane protein YckC
MRFICPRCSHTEEIAAPAPAACPSCGFSLAPATVEGTVSYDPNATRAYLGRTPVAPELPAVVGGYRLIRQIGAGGMGTVHEAEQIATGRRVALKLIRPEFAASRQAIDRFRREGRLAAAVTHPRCVFVLTADEDAGRPYIVMELMPGETLQDLVGRAGPLAPPDAVAKILDVLDGLAELHCRGVVHRDVKPGNCFLEADGRVKVGDFGLAFSLLADREAKERGLFAGTPLFASPEQHRGEPLDARTDVYSVCATLYYLLTGRPPFDGRDSESLLKRIETGPAPTVRALRPGIPAGLDRVMMRGLEREPHRRWQDPDSLRQALVRFGPARLSSVGLRLRVAAYVIDWLVVTAAMLAVAVPAMLLLRSWLPGLYLNPLPIPDYNICTGNVKYDAGNALLAAAAEYLYFGFFEGIYGCGLGKWLMGLRVVGVGTTRSPGIARALARATLFCVLLYVPRYLLDFIDVPCFVGVLCGLMSWWNLGCLALIASTMRERNGYRGLHDYVSGTCVIRVARAAQPAGEGLATWFSRPFLDRLAEPMFPPTGLPETIGPFEVRGVLARHPAGGVILAEDAALGRKVVLWLRPLEEQPLSAARRGANRLTRLRWLAEGVEGTRRWDAFVAEDGRPLPDLVAEGGPFSWAETQTILQKLTDELAAACADETFPRPVFPIQVWLQPEGGMFLFDLPPEGAQDVVERAPATDDRRGLQLLAEVAVLALEGGVRPIGRAAPPLWAGLPHYASEILVRLLVAGPAPYERLRDLQADLAAVRDRPTRLPRARRLAQVALQGVIFVTAAVLATGMGELIDRALRDRPYGPAGSADAGLSLRALVWLPCYVIPAAGLTWAALMRGGPTFFICGVALVRADGRRAAWWQALLRSFLAWVEGAVALVLIPYGAYFVLALFADSTSVKQESVETVLLYVWLGWVLLFTTVAVWLPRRPLIDRIVGTYLVPR